MAFVKWWKAISLRPGTHGTDDTKIEARSRNLASEDRHVTADDFRESMVDLFQSSSVHDYNSALSALNLKSTELFDPRSAFLGLLPTSSAQHAGWQPVSFMTAKHIWAKLEPNFDWSAPVLAPQVILPTPLYATSPRKFIWAANSVDVADLSPTDVAIKLGLPHFLPGDAVYRVDLPPLPPDVYIPTCFDAGLYEAWRIPPAGHTAPWGLTRNLVTGDDGVPEIVIPLAAVENSALTARLVRRGGVDRVGAYTSDFLCKRTDRGIPP